MTLLDILAAISVKISFLVVSLSMSVPKEVMVRWQETWGIAVEQLTGYPKPARSNDFFQIALGSPFFVQRLAKAWPNKLENSLQG